MLETIEKPKAAPIEMPPIRRTLFGIGADMMALDEMLSQIEGDLSDPATAQAIDEWIAENSENLEVKVDGYCALMQEYKARSDARKAEAKRLLELAKADENRAERLKERLKFFFESQGMTKLDTPRYSLTLAKNGGKTPLILDEDADWEAIGKLYPECVVTHVEPSKDHIRAALEAGDRIPCAMLGERGTSLRIR